MTKRTIPAAVKAPAADRVVDSRDNRPAVLITTDELAREHPSHGSNLLKIELKASTAPKRIDDDETCGHWQDVIKLLDAEAKTIEGVRVAVKEPYLAAGRVVDGFFQDLKLRATKTRNVLASIVEGHLIRKRNAERARLEEEAHQQRLTEERLRREAALAEEIARQRDAKGKQAAASEKRVEAAVAEQEAEVAAAEAALADALAKSKSADLARNRSTEGSLGTLADHWDFEITDYNKLPAAELWAYVPAKQREQAVRAFVKAGGRVLRGARIFPATKLQVR